MSCLTARILLLEQRRDNRQSLLGPKADECPVQAYVFWYIYTIAIFQIFRKSQILPYKLMTCEQRTGSNASLKAPLRSGMELNFKSNINFLVADRYLVSLQSPRSLATSNNLRCNLRDLWHLPGFVPSNNLKRCKEGNIFYH